jgi:hypothetical protein
MGSNTLDRFQGEEIVYYKETLVECNNREEPQPYYLIQTDILLSFFMRNLG